MTLPPALAADWVRAAAGGVLIGLAAGGFRLFAGEIAGISGIVRRALTGPARGWRLAFIAGLVLVGAIASLRFGATPARGIEALSPVRATVAGLLVGLGSGFGNGCTSGHGVCGLARLSRRSLAAVATFMATAGLTVFVLRHGLPL